MPLSMSSAAGTSPRAGLLDPDEQRVIEERRARRLHRLAHREVWSFALFAGGFLAVAILMAVLLPSHRSPGIGAVLVLIAAYAAAFRLDFEIGTGSAVPTQLILCRCSSCFRPATCRWRSRRESCSGASTSTSAARCTSAGSCFGS